MSDAAKTIRFYTKPLLILTLVNALILIFYGAYFEDYEGIFSSIVQGVYSKPTNMWYDTTNYFLILAIPEHLLPFVAPYNVYGLMLLFYDLFCLSFAGLVLYRVLRINLSYTGWPLFILLYLLVCIDNIINLNCTRHALILIIAVFGLIESVRLEGKTFSGPGWLGIFLLMLLANLFRFEAALLISSFYIVIMILFKRHSKYMVLPVALSVFFITLFYVLVQQYSNEAVKVFVFKEKEVTSRNNLDTSHLSSIHKLDVEAIQQYFITDKEHYTMAFYDTVARYKPLALVGSVNFHTFLNNLLVSGMESFPSLYYLFLFAISGYIVLRKNKGRKAYRMYFAFFLVVPFLLCFYTVLPSRFIDPYFGFLSCLNIFFLIRNPELQPFARRFCMLALMLLMLKGYWSVKKYREENRKYRLAMDKLDELGKKYHKTVVINNFYTDKYFPVSPFSRLPERNVRFLNFYLFNAWDAQREDWKNYCHCNPLSLPDKVNFVIESKSVFIVDEFSFGFMQKYLSEKYHVKLAQKDIEKFNEYQSVCFLSYSDQP